MLFKFPVKIVLLVVMSGLCSVPYAARSEDISSKNMLLRLERVERMMQNNSQTPLLSKLRALQKENQQLRSLIEELSYKHEKLKNRLQSLNEDMDRRVMSLESAASNQQSAVVAEQDQQQAQTDNNTSPANGENIQQPEIQNPEQYLIEQKKYQTAFNELKALRYGKAEQSFKDFLIQYPDSQYAQLAQYWLAESSYAQRKFKQSIKHYSDLLLKYNNTPKLVEAKLKIAYCYFELGDYKTAKSNLKNIVNNYPNSTEAVQARRLLKKFR